MAEQEPPLARADLDRAVEALTANLSDLRQELAQRLETLEHRTERTEINTSAIQMQLVGMSKSLSYLERQDGQTVTTQFAQQRAIDDLYAQIAEIKRSLPRQQQ